MTKITKALNKLVDKATRYGLVDDLVAAELEYQIGSCFEDLIQIRERAGAEGVLQSHHADDFIACVQFVKAALVVLRWYTTDKYKEEQKKVNEEEDWLKYTIYGVNPYA